jgi:DNA-binding response OmpR family regulator
VGERLLLIEDDSRLAEMVGEYLGKAGFHVIHAENGTRGLALHGREPVDAVILDLMLPDTDGLEICRQIRARSDSPILMLTARGDPMDRVVGLEMGADDYLPKPFELAILLARIHGLLRRRRWNEQDAEPDEAQSEVFAFAGRTLDFGAMEVRALGKSHRLTQMECDLLRYLVKNAGQAVSRGTILEDVWGLHESTDTRAIDNFIVRLRRYIEDRPASPKILLTVRGVGYKFVTS